MSLAEFIRRSPLAGMCLDIGRSRDVGRPQRPAETLVQFLRRSPLARAGIHIGKPKA
jgi:hypothetical protein